MSPNEEIGKMKQIRKKEKFIEEEKEEKINEIEQGETNGTGTIKEGKRVSKINWCVS